MPKKNRPRLTRELFISDAHSTHNSVYCYDGLPDSVNKITQHVPVSCRAHGVWNTTYARHVINGVGCHLCKRDNKISADSKLKKFLSDCANTHGDRYNYSLITHISSGSDQVRIICGEHGEFTTQARAHSSARTHRGCPACAGNVPWTQELLIAAGRAKYGDQFNYSQVPSKFDRGQNTQITIICRDHGPVATTVVGHISSSRGCTRCSLSERLSREKFVRDSRALYGELYDYNNLPDAVNKINQMVPVTCGVHGDWLVSYQRFVNNKIGCINCRRDSRIKLQKSPETESERIAHFIAGAQREHGTKYDYSHITKLASMSHKVSVRCPTHGYFLITASNHTKRGSAVGCVDCAGNRKLTRDVFIRRANEIHGKRYDYSSVPEEFRDGISTRIEIICGVHGEFSTQVNWHLLDRVGCARCAKNAPMTQERFLTRAQDKHGTTYEYSHLNVTSVKQNITLTCPKHGEFSLSVGRHIDTGTGCKKCTPSSRGEERIVRLLDSLGVTYNREHKFVNCRNPVTGRLLRYDFWLPDHNLLIEFHGKQHYVASNFSSSRTIEQQTRAEVEFAASVARDEIKKNYAASSGHRLLIIKYTDITNIDRIIKPKLYNVT